jgi:hypothetical protein
VESWYEYFRLGDLLVIDDDSDEPETLKYLDVLEKSGTSVYRVKQPSLVAYKNGGLHENMDFAISHAASKGYDYVFFIQDDNQFVWHDPEIVEKVHDYFTRFPKLCMVQNVFLGGIRRAAGRLKDGVKIIENESSYHVKGNAMLDVGIVKTSLIQKHGFKWALGKEWDANRWWRHKGYFALLLKAPNLCFIPEPDVVRERVLSTVRSKPPFKYFMKPLDESQIDRLLQMKLEDIPIWEDFCETWGWHCKKPYFWRSYEDYYIHYYKAIYSRKYARAIKCGRRLIPYRVRKWVSLICRD